MSTALTTQAKGGKGKAAAKKAPAKKAAKSGGKKGNADQEIIDQFNGESE